MSLTYVVPEKPFRSFVKGDIVDVMSREGSVLSAEIQITGAARESVFIADGRQFLAESGWWVGETDSYPFPWLRHTPGVGYEIQYKLKGSNQWKHYASDERKEGRREDPCKVYARVLEHLKRARSAMQAKFRLLKNGKVVNL